MRACCRASTSILHKTPFVRILLDNAGAGGGGGQAANKEVNFSFLFSGRPFPCFPRRVKTSSPPGPALPSLTLAKTSIYVKQPTTWAPLMFGSYKISFCKDNFELLVPLVFDNAIGMLYS